MKLSMPFTIPTIKNNKLSSYYELTKPGITFAVLASMLIGFILGSGNQINYSMMLQAAIVTWLVASGTAAHNQYLEWQLDKKMKRTRHRPVPSKEITPGEALFLSLGLILAGLEYLLVFVNVRAGLISLLTTLIYLGAYTPMKRISAFNVFIGAVPGDLPPVGDGPQPPDTWGDLPCGRYLVLFSSGKFPTFWPLPGYAKTTINGPVSKCCLKMTSMNTRLQLLCYFA